MEDKYSDSELTKWLTDMVRGALLTESEMLEFLSVPEGLEINEISEGQGIGFTVNKNRGDAIWSFVSRSSGIEGVDSGHLTLLIDGKERTFRVSRQPGFGGHPALIIMLKNGTQPRA
jgi:hypothetical protein